MRSIIETATALTAAFSDFDRDPEARVAVLFGDGGHFCAGADLKQVAQGQPNQLSVEGDGPMGPTRMRLQKPVIAAISGYAVAGGLELACFAICGWRKKARCLACFVDRFCVPLIDGWERFGLPQIIGLGRALRSDPDRAGGDGERGAGDGAGRRVVPTGMARQSAGYCKSWRGCRREDCLAVIAWRRCFSLTSLCHAGHRVESLS